MKRFIIEFGMGMDFHGQDVNKAAVKAVRDAVSRSCLSGLVEVLGIEDLDNAITVHVTVAVRDPVAVRVESIAEVIPVGKVTVDAVKGGLTVPGIYLSKFGDKDDSIEAAIACVEVRINE